MKRRNCWEAKQCGREMGGLRSFDLGVCPAAQPSSYDGINGGKYSGRICWAVENTHCHAHLPGGLVEKFKYCLQCDFFREVHETEGVFFVLTAFNRRRDKTVPMRK